MRLSILQFKRYSQKRSKVSALVVVRACDLRKSSVSSGGKDVDKFQGSEKPTDQNGCSSTRAARKIHSVLTWLQLDRWKVNLISCCIFYHCCEKMKLGRGKPVMRRHLWWGYTLKLRSWGAWLFFQSKLMRDHQPLGTYLGVSRAWKRGSFSRKYVRLFRSIIVPSVRIRTYIPSFDANNNNIVPTRTYTRTYVAYYAAASYYEGNRYLAS